ncbi:hypothetical protein KR093_001929 [Drosophila rubida]|uniref:Mediator of RNA polymerase II transcription subunit 26 n=1 Tax=Drosophila rubida TaxID=30044 RepID=A0AAD4PPI4_9MUSC|nr:hypothetical protein KR093_001929 [Drosophila rubida]
MNQNQIQQLTLHLSQALDQNYDVVNMETVLSVICALEGTTITKDQLEATRLAKYINQLRRRTKNEQLARRAKSLLKKWREMVGIQHAVIDSQPIKPIGIVNVSESNISDNNSNAPHQYCSNQPGSTPPPNRAISDLHSHIEISNPQCVNDTPQQQSSFSNLIKHINNVDSEESCKAIKNQRNVEQQKSATFINEVSTNSISNLAIGTSSDKLKDSSIVIDIVSDSDENDCGTQPCTQPKFTTSSSSLTFPIKVYPKPKKIKKDKKRKDKAQHSSLLYETHSQKSKINLQKSGDFNYYSYKDAKVTKMFPNDSEILSLSNSSMSSILSGDALSMPANSQNKIRSTCDLTFAGRFKSVVKVGAAFNHENSNGQKTDCRISEIEQPILKTIYEDYIHNDSSTSCSRLSSFEEQSRRVNSKSFVEPNKPDQQLLSYESHKVDYIQENPASDVPKKRGRKKGSKGVDSVIAKESSLSQQIFFGSGVKKVKTTKELFNEIQSRKLSISYNRNVTCPPETADKRSNIGQPQRESTRSLITRPTSSCSETSMNSPHILEANSANVNILDDTGNTDSDTITSEPSHDSIKSESGEIKRSTSLESISSSIQTPSLFKNTKPSTITKKINHNNDVTTELMHLINGLNSPQSVDDTEKLYQAQIVPCTCVIQEETKILNESQSISQIEAEEFDATENNYKKCTVNAFECLSSKPINTYRTEEVANAMPQKPFKSIFDLDFDDDDDPLQSILTNVLKVEPISNVQSGIHNNDNENFQSVKLRSEVSLAQFAGTSNGTDHEQNVNENSEKVLETLSIYTVVEDPNCVAKKRFMLQTNQVTNYHVNVLHNLFVPNINGNWNSIVKKMSSSILKSKISHIFQNEFNSYKVSDGADVVPKYGSLTCNERIPKDLSSLKFNVNFPRKFPKSRKIQPFLGIAKCLPSCRLAAKRAKNYEMKSTLKLSADENLKTIKHSSWPLTVDVNVLDNHNHNQYYAEGKDIKSSNKSSTLFSCDLLKFANNPETSCQPGGIMNQTTSGQIDQDYVERNRKKRRKSTKLLSAINLIESEYEDNTKPSIKRIKIALNGNIAAQQKKAFPSRRSNSSSDDDASECLSTGSEYHRYQKNLPVSENDMGEHESNSNRSISSVESIADEDDGLFENDNNNDDNVNEYAIVQKPMMDSGNNHTHIVLTIKKTPNKINSPASSTSAVSPINVNSIIGVASDAESATIEDDHFNVINNKKISNIPQTCLQKCYRNRCQCRRYRNRRSLKHQICRKEESIDLELKHLFNNNNNIARTIQSKAKTHRKLFFTKELYREDNVGRKERVINYTSSSSNCDEESESEGDRTKKKKIALKNNFELKIETDTTSTASIKNLMTAKSGQKNEDLYLSSSDESVKDELLFGNQHVDGTKFDIIQGNESPIDTHRNNGMLLSFNSIYDNDIIDVTQLQSLQIENCDDVNSICYNSNNLSLIKPYSLDSPTITPNIDTFKVSNNSPNLLANYSKLNNSLQPHIEYKSGIRAIVEDNSSILQVQQFKEWHEVLQLQSYNNEPLIVLPYVVLE